ncbi:Probable polyol transporter 4 [Linum grandiflorum]
MLPSVIGRAADLIEEDLSLTTDQIDHYLMMVHSCVLVGGAVAAGVAANFFGRKYTAAVGSGSYAVGVLVLAFARSFAVATCGRALAGFGTGMGLLVGPIYIAEIAPVSMRSYLSHFPQMMLALGMMTAYALEAAFTRVHPHTAWRLTIGLFALPSSIVTVLVCCIPDSPAWLVMLGKVDLAKKFLEYCRGPVEEDDAYNILTYFYI